MRAALLFSAVLAAALVLGVSPAGATTECRGLRVCVHVVGPWVVVPTGSAVPRRSVRYRMSCPRGYLVGGLDAELTVRAIDIQFLGALGSPVNPGVTTSRSVVFVATYVGGSARAPTARPRLGCIPSSGGGARIPTSASVVPPGRPALWRVRTERLRPGRTQLIAKGCATGERLVDASHAVGFYTRRPPAASLVESVSATRSIRAGRVVVTVRSGASLAGTRAVVQVAAICAGGQ